MPLKSPRFAEGKAAESAPVPLPEEGAGSTGVDRARSRISEMLIPSPHFF